MTSLLIRKYRVRRQDKLCKTLKEYVSLLQGERGFLGSDYRCLSSRVIVREVWGGRDQKPEVYLDDFITANAMYSRWLEINGREGIVGDLRAKVQANRQKQIIKLASQGYNQAEIGRQVGLTREAVRTYVKRKGFEEYHKLCVKAKVALDAANQVLEEAVLCKKRQEMYDSIVAKLEENDDPVLKRTVAWTSRRKQYKQKNQLSVPTIYDVFKLVIAGEQNGCPVTGKQIKEKTGVSVTYACKMKKFKPLESCQSL